MSGTGGIREIKWVRRRDGIKRRHGSEVNGRSRLRKRNSTERNNRDRNGRKRDRRVIKVS